MKKKSYFTGTFLAIFLGPLGGFYADVWSGLVGTVLMLSCISADPDLGFVLLPVFIVLTLLVNLSTVYKHNKEIDDAEKKRQDERAELIAAIRAGHAI